jgi:hypothetical protein
VTDSTDTVMLFGLPPIDFTDDEFERVENPGLDRQFSFPFICRSGTPYTWKWSPDFTKLRTILLRSTDIAAISSLNQKDVECKQTITTLRIDAH